jgi:hypothetical protein
LNTTFKVDGALAPNPGAARVVTLAPGASRNRRVGGARGGSTALCNGATCRQARIAGGGRRVGSADIR